jgi:hypothetical protein
MSVDSIQGVKEMLRRKLMVPICEPRGNIDDDDDDDMMMI